MTFGNMAQETTELPPPAMARDRSGRRIDADEQAPHEDCDSNKRPREEADEKEHRRSRQPNERGYSRGVIQ
jgi:hypothetical protein